MTDLPAMRRPCANCPWRRDVAPGEFTVERFAEMTNTAYDQSFHLFTCHKSPLGGETVCAGFLERGADHNLAVRLAYSTRRLERLDRSGGHPLYDSYRDMAEANGVPEGDDRLLGCRSADS